MLACNILMKNEYVKCRLNIVFVLNFLSSIYSQLKAAAKRKRLKSSAVCFSLFF